MINKKKKIIQFSILGVGVLFIIIGIARGEVQTLFSKAINICLECIGIG